MRGIRCALTFGEWVTAEVSSLAWSFFRLLIYPPNP
jgi:hypothetical protein